MPDFKGFNDWVEIFRGGQQTDSNGHTHDGNSIIEKAVKSFNTNEHEPPIVVGHPKENAPAFGWVEKLKTATNDGVQTLMAKFHQVVPEFASLAEQGMYKKRSASFYQDGRLRHVGFLGAAPPAVKGLADLKFEGDETGVIEFSSNWGLASTAGIFRRLREWFLEKEGKEVADAIIPDWDVDEIKASANQPETPVSEVGFTICLTSMLILYLPTTFFFALETPILAMPT